MEKTAPSPVKSSRGSQARVATPANARSVRRQRQGAKKEKKGVELFLAGRRKKEEIECRHLSLGKCIAGTRCGFMHVGGNGQRDGTTNTTWEAIQCANPRRESGWCAAAPNCIFSPCAERQRQARYAQMVGLPEQD